MPAYRPTFGSMGRVGVVAYRTFSHKLIQDA